MKHAIFTQLGSAGIAIAQVAFMKLRKKGVRLTAVVRVKDDYSKYYGKGAIPVIGAGFDFYHMYFKDIPYRTLLKMDFPDNVLPVCVYTNEKILREYLDAADIIICCRGLTGLSDLLDMMHQYVDSNKTIYLNENDYSPLDHFKKIHGKKLRLKFICCMIDRVCKRIDYLDDKIVANADQTFSMIINEPENQSIIAASEDKWPNIRFMSNEGDFMTMWEKKRLTVNYPHFYLALLAFDKALEEGINVEYETDIRLFLDDNIVKDINTLAAMLFGFWYLNNVEILKEMYNGTDVELSALKEFFSYYEQSMKRIFRTEDSIQRILKIDQTEAFKRKCDLMMDKKLFAISNYLMVPEEINDMLNNAGLNIQVDMDRLPRVQKNLQRITAGILKNCKQDSPPRNGI